MYYIHYLASLFIPQCYRLQLGHTRTCFQRGNYSLMEFLCTPGSLRISILDTVQLLPKSVANAMMLCMIGHSWDLKLSARPDHSSLLSRPSLIAHCVLSTHFQVTEDCSYSVQQRQGNLAAGQHPSLHLHAFFKREAMQNFSLQTGLLYSLQQPVYYFSEQYDQPTTHFQKD